MSAQKHAREMRESASVAGCAPYSTTMCYCNKPAKRFVSTKNNANRGRGFYTCAGDRSTCRFWMWSTPSSLEKVKTKMPEKLRDQVTEVQQKMYDAANEEQYVLAGMLQTKLRQLTDAY